ncbi:hypothetical protein [Acidocella sp.]|jgi:hypothetical protein|uniref:hypothetical protein n=1 Tax=Acidocella sp. TaxID=50710 RepID=UPI0026269424|nr:hypothetical protein [Acidocella sp.]
MKVFRLRLLSAVSLTALLGLAACGGDSQPDAAKASDPLQFCPPVAVLQQAQTVTLFLPGRSDIAAQISTAQITGISGQCTYRKKGKTPLLEVKFTASFLAANGPANHGQPVTLPWFVAITKGDQILDKKEYSIKLGFDGNMSKTAAVSKPVVIDLPPSPASARLQILAGFEMTPEQLAYAAAHPGAAP